MKCVPTSSPGRSTASASSSIGMEEVLVISSVPGRTLAETSERTLALSSAFSVIASMTAVARPTASGEVAVVSSPGSVSGGRALISWASRSSSAIFSVARSSRSRSMSTRWTGRPWPRASAVMPTPITPAPSTVSAWAGGFSFS